MKKRQYRLKVFKYDNTLYNVEVRFKGLFFWSKWYRIGSHTDGQYDLYSKDSTGYPKNREECDKIIEDYDKQWVKHNTIKKRKYIDCGVYE